MAWFKVILNKIKSQAFVTSVIGLCLFTLMYDLNVCMRF